MASIVSNLARAAASSVASVAAVRGIAGGRRPISPCLPRLYRTGDAFRRMCSGVPPAGKLYQLEKSGANSEPEKRPSRIEDPYLVVGDAKLIESKEAIYELYDYWCKYHGIIRDRAERARRFKTFKSTAMLVHKANNSGEGYKFALSHRADTPMKEMFYPTSRRRYF